MNLTSNIYVSLFFKNISHNINFVKNIYSYIEIFINLRMTHKVALEPKALQGSNSSKNNSRRNTSFPKNFGCKLFHKVP